MAAIRACGPVADRCSRSSAPSAGVAVATSARRKLGASFRRALVATATPADGALLREHLSATGPQARIAAIVTLAHVSGEAADADARRLLSDSDELVQAAAARALADHGRRESLAPLVRLLGSAETPVRIEAARTLRAAT